MVILQEKSGEIAAGSGSMAGLYKTNRSAERPPEEEIVENRKLSDVLRLARENPKLRYLATTAVFECSFCKTKYYAGDNRNRQIDKLLESGCKKCGGRITFRGHRNLVE